MRPEVGTGVSFVTSDTVENVCLGTAVINMPPTKQFMVAGHEFLCYNCKGLHPSSCTISDVMAV